MWTLHIISFFLLLQYTTRKGIKSYISLLLTQLFCNSTVKLYTKYADCDCPPLWRYQRVWYGTSFCDVRCTKSFSGIYIGDSTLCLRQQACTTTLLVRPETILLTIFHKYRQIDIRLFQSVAFRVVLSESVQIYSYQTFSGAMAYRKTKSITRMSH